MKRISRIVSAAILVVHLTVGCCAHHAHAWYALGNVVPNPVSLQAHSLEVEISSYCAGGTRTEPQLCDEETCSAVSPEPTGVELFGQSSYMMPAVYHLCGQVAIESGQHLLSAGHFLLPVRLHLVNHVLLI